MSNQTHSAQIDASSDLGPALISVRDLNVHYGAVPALDCPELHVPQGAIVTVIGANGAGKSTLLNAMMGNLPTNGHARGDVFYSDQQVSDWSVEQRVGQGLSLVPESRELFASMTVEENLLLGGFRLYLQRVSRWRLCFTFTRDCKSGGDSWPGLCLVVSGRCWR